MKRLTLQLGHHPQLDHPLGSRSKGDQGEVQKIYGSLTFTLMGSGYAPQTPISEALAKPVTLFSSGKEAPKPEIGIQLGIELSDPGKGKKNHLRALKSAYFSWTSPLSYLAISNLGEVLSSHLILETIFLIISTREFRFKSSL